MKQKVVITNPPDRSSFQLFSHHPNEEKLNVKFVSMTQTWWWWWCYLLAFCLNSVKTRATVEPESNTAQIKAIISRWRISRWKWQRKYESVRSGCHIQIYISPSKIHILKFVLQKWRLKEVTLSGCFCHLLKKWNKYQLKSVVLLAWRVF